MEIQGSTLDFNIKNSTKFFGKIRYPFRLSLKKFNEYVNDLRDVYSTQMYCCLLRKMW